MRPRDEGMLDLAVWRRELITHLIRSECGSELTPESIRLVEGFDRAKAKVASAHRIQDAGLSFAHNGNTRHVRTLFKVCDIRLVAPETRRQAIKRRLRVIEGKAAS